MTTRTVKCLGSVADSPWTRKSAKFRTGMAHNYIHRKPSAVQIIQVQCGRPDSPRGLRLPRVNQAPKRRAANGGGGSLGTQRASHTQSWGTR